jgi:hypothetical protein
MVEAGFRLRPPLEGFDAEFRSVVESARDGLGVLLGLLLGFSLLMALPHFEQRTQLVTDEANTIATVAQRAELLPDPFRDKMVQPLREYIHARLEFADAESDAYEMIAVNRAKRLQNEIWQQTVMLVQQNLTIVTPLFVRAVGQLSDMIEQRLAATEKHIPTAIWLIFILISMLTCFVVGYCMRRRVLLGMLVVPLTVAIVLSLVSELDNPRAGFVRISQQSMLRLQWEIDATMVPHR